jgi:hypothetical protein
VSKNPTTPTTNRAGVIRVVAGAALLSVPITERVAVRITPERRS